MIIIKSREELKIMRKAGEIAAIILWELSNFLKSGIKAQDLDKKSQEYFEKYEVKSLFLGYKGFPGHICVAIEEEVVHGIPGNRVIKEGDLVNIDVGVIYKGYCADVGESYIVGLSDNGKKQLLETTREALAVGIKEAISGKRLGCVSSAIQNYVESKGYSVVKKLCGHGIGKKMHEDPSVPNYGKPSDGPILREGMTMAIEPMVNMGKDEVMLSTDNWTVITKDGKPSCQFEHTIVVTKDGGEILTKLPD